MDMGVYVCVSVGGHDIIIMELWTANRRDVRQTVIQTSL